ncbi:Heavy-metal resistance [Pseudomonas pohangensis]|jgi:Spy/CpxP family protein refolding chaperone|uniref:Signaling pathway modulator ZraP n=1 Tax=Pseudomonas pohangensis TaxID=364197 RepID=A0A1H2EQ92_9PSED|nr:periplasmic heavy metal sensor [Pseudomonas pohangensis]SDT97296.1 Heavy-metal resistance [Pseudomonas pohangensis]
MNKSRLLAGALLLSLAANVFLGSWLLTRSAHHSGFAQMQGDPGGPRLKHLMGRMQKLPDEQRQQIREKMRELAPQMQALVKASREQRQAIEQLMQAPQLDTGQLQAAFAGQREIQEKMQDLRQQMLIGIAGTLTPEQRVQLFQGKAR